MAGLNAGSLDRRIAFERNVPARDAMNAETESWQPLAQAWASVSYGTGQERRAAAQEGASVAATFRTRWNSVLDTVVAKDRILFDGAAWDITSAAPFGRRLAIDFTAVRAA